MSDQRSVPRRRPGVNQSCKKTHVLSVLAPAQAQRTTLKPVPIHQLCDHAAKEYSHRAVSPKATRAERLQPAARFTAPLCASALLVSSPSSIGGRGTGRPCRGTCARGDELRAPYASRKPPSADVFLVATRRGARAIGRLASFEAARPLPLNSLHCAVIVQLVAINKPKYRVGARRPQRIPVCFYVCSHKHQSYINGPRRTM